MKNLLILLSIFVLWADIASAQNTRIKDIVAFEGIRENMLVGYGLVVGLNGTGDKLQNNAFTEQSLIAFLERQGVNTRGQNLKTKNVAAVTVTAKLPPFARAGAKIDVSLSAMGDAKSLQGGVLLATPLYGADGQVYTVAQGGVTINGFSATGASGTSITKGVPTNAIISGGGVVEREVGFALNTLDSVKLALRNPDLSTAHNISRAINSRLGPEASVVTDPGTVQVSVPPEYKNAVAYLLADIEQLKVATDQVAKVVIDEATGTIVMGENVRIDTVAIAQGNLVVRIEETPQVSQPNPFAPFGATTEIVPRSEVAVDEESDAKLAVLNSGASLKQLVGGLNALGVGPRDMIAILQNIKAAGALQAEIETR
ncbi:MAG: flagellar basal body P-ring protein FlgI [Rickettsiales bacterium]|nr:flagellar basal body P-ring protein FlgI [Rickettsiales bacterium]